MVLVQVVSINRIRLEFKVVLERLFARESALVLIESDWNLKQPDADIEIP